MNKLCVSLGHCCGPVTMESIVRGRGMWPYWATGIEREGEALEMNYFSHWSHLHLYPELSPLVIFFFPSWVLSLSLNVPVNLSKLPSSSIQLSPSAFSLSLSLTMSLSLHPFTSSLFHLSFHTWLPAQHISLLPVLVCGVCVCLCVYSSGWTSCWFAICCSRQLTRWACASDASDLCVFASLCIRTTVCI